MPTSACGAVNRVSIPPLAGGFQAAYSRHRGTPARGEARMSRPSARTLLLVAAVAFVATSSRAEPVAGKDRPLLRPADDSDLEMRALWDQFRRTRFCSCTIPGCAFDWTLLTRDGERMADYLIRQTEASTSEGYPAVGTYLVHIAATQSERGIRYVLDAYNHAPSYVQRIATLQALHRAEDARAARVAYEALRGKPLTPHHPDLAMTVLTANLLAPGAATPEILSFLEELAGEQSPRPGMRARAISALDDVRYERNLKPLRDRSGELASISTLRGGSSSRGTNR